MVHDPYNDIQRSLLAYCNNFLQRNNLDTDDGANWDVFDFDVPTVNHEMPANNVIGIADYSIENTGDKYHVTCMVMVCTLSTDTKLENLRSAIGGLFAELRPGATGETLTVVDESGTKRGYFTVMDEVMVSPVATTKTRPIQGIAISLGVGYLALP